MLIWQPLILEKGFYRGEGRRSDNLLLRGRTTLREKRCISDLSPQRACPYHRIFPPHPNPLLFSAEEASSTVSSPRLRVSFPLPGQTTLHMPLFPAWLLRSSNRHAANTLLMKEGRGSPKGTLLTEGRDSYGSTRHILPFLGDLRGTYLQSFQLERAEHKRGEREGT